MSVSLPFGESARRASIAVVDMDLMSPTCFATAARPCVLRDAPLGRSSA
jgi:hypothetical protein